MTTYYYIYLFTSDLKHHLSGKKNQNNFKEKQILNAFNLYKLSSNKG